MISDSPVSPRFHPQGNLGKVISLFEGLSGAHPVGVVASFETGPIFGAVSLNIPWSEMVVGFRSKTMGK